MNLGGGTHHAGHDFARGYCLFNDVAVALAELRRDGLADRALIVDCDVHQGDGTAADLRRRPAHVHALPARRAQLPVLARRRPTSTSTSPRAPATGATCARWPRRWTSRSTARGPTTRSTWPAPTRGRATGSGRLALTKAGPARARRAGARPAARGAGAAVCVVLAGGYAEDIRDTVDINAATAAAVAERVRVARPRLGDSRRAACANAPGRVTLVSELRKVQGEARQTAPRGGPRPPTPGQPPPLPSPGAGGMTPSGAGVAALPLSRTRGRGANGNTPALHAGVRGSIPLASTPLGGPQRLRAV